LNHQPRIRGPFSKGSAVLISLSVLALIAAAGIVGALVDTARDGFHSIPTRRDLLK
jgi:hypothetical protein